MKLSIIDIVKLFFTGIKPAKEVLKVAEGAKGSGWKTPAFWVTLLASLTSFVLAIKAVIPATISAIIIAVLTGLYNAVRAYINAQQEGVQAPFFSTRFWTLIAGVLLVLATDLQTAGLSGPLLTSIIGALTAIGTASQTIGASEPSDKETRA